MGRNKKGLYSKKSVTLFRRAKDAVINLDPDASSVIYLLSLLHPGAARKLQSKYERILILQKTFFHVEELVQEICKFLNYKDQFFLSLGNTHIRTFVITGLYCSVRLMNKERILKTRDMVVKRIYELDAAAKSMKKPIDKLLECEPTLEIQLEEIKARILPMYQRPKYTDSPTGKDLVELPESMSQFRRYADMNDYNIAQNLREKHTSSSSMGRFASNIQRYAISSGLVYPVFDYYSLYPLVDYHDRYSSLLQELACAIRDNLSHYSENKAVNAVRIKKVYKYIEKTKVSKLSKMYKHPRLLVRCRK